MEDYKGVQNRLTKNGLLRDQYPVQSVINYRIYEFKAMLKI